MPSTPSRRVCRAERLDESSAILMRAALLTVCLALALFVMGCMKTTSLDDVQPTSGGEFDGAREAVIVIGHRVTETAEPDISVSDLEITWAQYDPERHRLIFSKPKRQETLVSVLTSPDEPATEGAPEGTHYSTKTIQAGCYILHTTRARSMSPLTPVFGPTYLSTVTVFAGSIETTGRRNHRPVAGSGAPAFCVEGGEVAYIGDYLFDVSSRPARLLAHANSFAEARQFMDESYPEYAKALVDREVVYE